MKKKTGNLKNSGSLQSHFFHRALSGRGKASLFPGLFFFFHESVKSNILLNLEVLLSYLYILIFRSLFK